LRSLGDDPVQCCPGAGGRRRNRVFFPDTLSGQVPSANDKIHQLPRLDDDLAHLLALDSAMSARSKASHDFGITSM
jgi:hypothetical protein